MSQPSTPLSHTAADLFLPSSMDQERQLSQADFDELFGSGGSGQPIFSSSNSDVLDELGFAQGDGSFVAIDSSNNSTFSTPDFSCYDFGQNAPAYPTPGPNSPNPYPLDLQRAYTTTVDEHEFNHRPQPTRAQTNDVHHYPVQASQGYDRRRSLSTGDTDRIVTTNSITNPTFVRLQAPRPRSTTPEDKRRHGPHFQHGRSASQGPAPRCRAHNPRSTPYHVYSNALVGGMLPTPIGTPLNEMMKAKDLNYGTGYNSAGIASLSIRPDDPVIRHMTGLEELKRSRQIIEIGALAVTSSSRLDPRLELHSPIMNRTPILAKLADIEEHLKDGEGEEALSACKTIRDVLTKKMGAEVNDVADGTVEDHLEVPSKVLAGVQCNMYDDHDDNEIMEMLMRENGVDGHDAEWNGKKE